MRAFIVIFAFLLPLTLCATENPFIGTWELRRAEIPNRGGMKYPIHRMTLSDDGIYRNSATPGGPIATNYQTEKDNNNHGQSVFRIQDPGSGVFEVVATLRLDKRGLVVSYLRDARIMIYKRISPTADAALLESVPKHEIVIDPQK